MQGWHCGQGQYIGYTFSLISLNFIANKRQFRYNKAWAKRRTFDPELTEVKFVSSGSEVEL